MQRNSKNIISVFVQQLWEIMEAEAQNSGLIRWSQTGLSFIILSEEEFSIKILSRYFNNNSKFSSFVRQLNMYNFRKIRNTGNLYEWAHDLFRRNHNELLAGIKRKPTQNDLQEARRLLKSLQAKTVGNSHPLDLISTPLPTSPSKDLKIIFPEKEQDVQSCTLLPVISPQTVPNHYYSLWNPYSKLVQSNIFTKKSDHKNQKLARLPLGLFFSQQGISTQNIQLQNIFEHLSNDAQSLRCNEQYMGFYNPPIMIPQPVYWQMPMNENPELQMVVVNYLNQ